MKTDCKIDSHIPDEYGGICECGYFKQSNFTKERIKFIRDTVSNFMNFKKDLIQIVLEDVPLYAQKRLLDELDIRKKQNYNPQPTPLTDN